MAEGLILQGFYENAAMFCSVEQKCNLYNVFLDYDRLLSESLSEGKRLGKKQKQKHEYYFFEICSRSQYQELFKHLTNIFSIQKIFFDHDLCSQNPILSKSLEIDEVELTED